MPRSKIYTSMYVTLEFIGKKRKRQKLMWHITVALIPFPINEMLYTPNEDFFQEKNYIPRQIKLAAFRCPHDKSQSEGESLNYWHRYTSCL